MTRRWIRNATIAMAGCLLLATIVVTSAWGKNMVVTTRQGQVWEGEVTEKGETVIIKTKRGEVKLNRANIASMEPAASNEEQFRARLAKLDKKDAAGRVELARWAVDRREYDLALDALDDAIAIDPNNEEARELQRTLLKQKRLPTSPDAKAGTPATGADGKAGAPPAEEMRDDEKTANSEKKRGREKTRLVTQDEINRIRQLELQKDEVVQVRLQNDVRRRYLSSSDWDPREFNKLPPIRQGFEILNNGSSKLHPDVVIATDPATMSEFKSIVQRNVLPGCATTSCHGVGPTGVGAEKAGDFVLHNPADKTVEMYTNFLLLQGYTLKTKEKDYAMVDRARPADSLVLQFGLPRADADAPHPEVQNFRPMFKGRNDPKYRAIEDWIGSTLSAVPPEYDIDLTKEPAGATTRPSRNARENE